MTIDEAIAHARDVAEKQRKDNDNCEYKAEYGCKGCADYYSKPCIECTEEHEQLAEWLELLKWYEQGMEDIPSESGVLPKDVYHAGYNKAIDDLLGGMNQITYNCQDADELFEKICDLAEQLKVGVTYCNLRN